MIEKFNQDFAPAAGSHKKITLDPKRFFGENTKYDEQMIILSKYTYLIPAQIKDLRERFIAWGLYPKHLEKEVKSRYPQYFKDDK